MMAMLSGDIRGRRSGICSYATLVSYADRYSVGRISAAQSADPSFDFRRVAKLSPVSPVLLIGIPSEQGIFRDLAGNFRFATEPFREPVDAKLAFATLTNNIGKSNIKQEGHRKGCVSQDACSFGRDYLSPNPRAMMPRR